MKKKKLKITTIDKFWLVLEKCEKEVSNWPEWKRKVGADLWNRGSSA